MARPLLYWAVAACATCIAPRALFAQDPAATPATGVRPHLAVILPLRSQSIGKLAEWVRRGIAAAAQVERGLPLLLYSTGDDTEQTLSAYQQALSSGARAVIGPFGRREVSALAASGLVDVPTLSLTTPEGERILPRMQYVFGLQLDAEARQVARLAQRNGYQRAFIVGSDAGPQKRAALAFAEEWRRLRGEVAGVFVLGAEVSALGKLRETLQNAAPDMVFLALDAPHARQVRGYLGTGAMIYATSQVFANLDDKLANFDLNGVRFLDMPWLLQPDHPAVLAYPRPEPRATLEQERFYALGVDAYRLIQSLLRSAQSIEEPLDGITGTLSAGADHVFQRELVPALFADGQAQALTAAP